MPVLNEARITKAWRHTGETGRIHYTVKKANGDPRHLVVDEGSALYEVLAQHLDALGYTGPKSAQEH